MSRIEQAFQGVIFNITYFKKIEDELFKYQLEHPDECIPIVPFFNQEHKTALDDFYVNDIRSAKSYDDYIFNVQNIGFPIIIKEFISRHPEWSKLVIRYD